MGDFLRFKTDNDYVGALVILLPVFGLIGLAGFVLSGPAVSCSIGCRMSGGVMEKLEADRTCVCRIDVPPATDGRQK